MKCFIVLWLTCIGSSYSFLFGGGSGPEWDSLKVTWGPNPLSREYFVKQPRTTAEAKKNGFEPIAGQCEGKFLGQRYIKGKDVGVILIFDKQGTIAGVQMAIPTSMITEKTFKFLSQRMFNRDNIVGIDVYILTAYFVDPSTICTSGRDATGLKNEGTGTGLWLQNGTNPISDSVQAPLYESGVSATKWTKGACFPSMGVHYWYDNRLEKDCDDFFPSFLMYNKGKLTGFGWAAVGKYEYTKRTEFPPYSAIKSFLNPVPTCMEQRYKDVGGFTTMHIYFNTAAWNLLC
ncbi:unnamed protein product [Rotaria sordida]|uniref:Uncharacterized protein n=1 Tax=Rotaria sordida TaxID=392033 RepID=A0A815PMW0_9BILA|nr:unnamed protein product [Rotaria sordida]